MFIDKVGLIRELISAPNYLIEVIDRFKLTDVDDVEKLIQRAKVVKWKLIRLRTKLTDTYGESSVNESLFEYGWRDFNKRILIQHFGDVFGSLYHEISSEYRDIQDNLKRNSIIELIIAILNYYNSQDNYFIGFDCINEYFDDNVEYVGNEIIRIFGAYYKFDRDFRFDDEVIEVTRIMFRSKETLKLKETILVEINGNKTITTTEIQKGVSV